MQAAAYLKKKGYRILEANFRCRFGEIDLIARDGAYLVFIEVKYRSSLKDGGFPGGCESEKTEKNHPGGRVLSLHASGKSRSALPV